MLTNYNARINVKDDTVSWLAKQFDNATVRNRGVLSLDKAKATLLYVQDHMVYDKIAEIFDFKLSTCWGYIQEGIRHLSVKAPALPFTLWTLASILADHPDAAEKGFLCVDTTLIWSQNTYRKGFYSGKHKRCGWKILTLSTPDGQPVWFSKAYPGSVHDMKILKEENLWQVLEIVNIGLVADRGFQGLDTEHHLLPVKKAKGGRLTAYEKEFNKWVSSLRVVVEFAYAKLKTVKSMFKNRQRLRNTPKAIYAAIGLLKLEGKGW